MANKVQQQLPFPVRKSGRQSKPSRIVLEAKDQDCSPVKSSARSRRKDHTPQGCLQSQVDTSFTSKRGWTPQRAASTRKKHVEADESSPCKRDAPPRRASSTRQKQPEAGASSSLKSPSKRKATSVESPPTPPKSPCKSHNKNSVHKTSRAPSPSFSVHSEDTDDDQCGSPPRPFVLPHTTPCGQTTASPERVTDRVPCTHRTPTSVPPFAARKVHNTELQHEFRSPSKRKLDNGVLPPPTPPLSPFVASPPLHRSASRESTSVCRTPMKKAHTSQQLHEGESGSPHRIRCSTPHKLQLHREASSPCRSHISTPQKQQPCVKSLSPLKTEPCTPPKLHCNRVLSPCKVGMATPQKVQQSWIQTLSPQKSPKQSPRRTLWQSPQKIRSPRKTLTQENEENFTLKSPKSLPKLHISKPDNSGYQRAKQSLHTAKPDHLVGRDQEVGEITTFLKSHLDKGSAGSLYISGAPGTGKTAALLHIIDDFKAAYSCQIAYLNCMMVKDVSSVFRRLHSELSGKPATGRTSVKDMEKLVTSSKHNMILVLDEIDQLDSKNQDVLYTIFEWPSLLHSKLILVGVANALDLTDRILPRLQAKPRCRPKLLHFAPYTRTQISAIIQDRLQQSGGAIVETSAIQFCARKVSAVAGDMRKALDVCRRAVELAESETRSQTVLKISDCNSPSKQQTPVMKKIGVSHISKVMSEVYGSSVQAQQSEGVPLQQKLLVCTLLLMVKTGKFKEVCLGKLHEMYCKVCRRQQMSPVDQSEFHSLCVLLEARGVIGLKKAKETRLIKVTLRQDEKELEQTLKDRVLVSAILADGLPK